LFASFKDGDPCESVVKKDNETITTIYPICGDTSVYIRRTIHDGTYRKEECFKNGKLFSQTNFTIYPDNSLDFDEFSYVNDSLYELKEHNRATYSIDKRSIPIKNSIYFDLYYFKNGNIKEYGLTEGNCRFGRTTELDSLGQYKWIGESDPTEKMDSVWLKSNSIDTMIIYTECGLKKGTWIKYDNNKRAIDSVKYVDGKIKSNR
jgi:hypothetical protein